MEKKEIEIASAEYIAEMVSKLSIAFYETPETLFEALGRTIIHLKMNKKDVFEMVEEAIFTIRKTKITIADVINGRENPTKEIPFFD